MVVSALYEYPVKGFLGNSICCATVNKRGLAMDRRWMLADAEGNFISQRQLPTLTQFLPNHQDYLTIRHLPSGEEHKIIAEDFTELAEVSVWGQQCAAHGTDSGINQWLSQILATPVRLVYMDENDLRPLKSASTDDMVSFADGYPVLLTSLASLQDLNSRLPEPVNINRFRPNIVVDGDLPFAEDHWQQIKIGEVSFTAAKRCGRCQVINIDQETGLATKEPLKTLSTYRQEKNKVNFGINLIPQSTGIIHQDDEVIILA
jgi:MOSC domain-containing protein